MIPGYCHLKYAVTIENPMGKPYTAVVFNTVESNKIQLVCIYAYLECDILEAKEGGHDHVMAMIN